MNEEEYEIWRYYEYLDNKINKEITLRNNDTVSIGNYDYDLNDNLVKIQRVSKEGYETELFKYNQDNKLIEEEIISTANPIAPEVSFSAGNNVRKYDYDSTGFKISETVYNHKGEVRIMTIFLKIEKN